MHWPIMRRQWVSSACSSVTPAGARPHMTVVVIVVSKARTRLHCCWAVCAQEASNALTGPLPNLHVCFYPGGNVMAAKLAAQVEDVVRARRCRLFPASGSRCCRCCSFPDRCSLASSCLSGELPRGLPHVLHNSYACRQDDVVAGPRESGTLPPSSHDTPPAIGRLPAPIRPNLKACGVHTNKFG